MELEISIHAPRTGSDRRSQASPRWDKAHFNPRSPHGERHAFSPPDFDPLTISIHAPRTGSDGNEHGKSNCHLHFNPRSPHGERRILTRREETPYLDFNPRSPHGERRLWSPNIPGQIAISIHAPRTGSDSAVGSRKMHSPIFQSTLPARGATFVSGSTVRAMFISIHAPRTGSDSQTPLGAIKPTISIHAPRTGSDWEFLYLHIQMQISIHAPRTGSDADGV